MFVLLYNKSRQNSHSNYWVFCPIWKWKCFLSSFKTIIQYIDNQFERYLHDESGLNRRHIVDNRVHCCFYFISPFGHGWVYRHSYSAETISLSLTYTCLFQLIREWNLLMSILNSLLAEVWNHMAANKNNFLISPQTVPNPLPTITFFFSFCNVFPL